MARTARLILPLSLAVLALHALLLQMLAVAWREPTVLRPMTTPMFTREIMAQRPVAPAPRQRPKAAAKPRQPAVDSSAIVAAAPPASAPVNPEPAAPAVVAPQAKASESATSAPPPIEAAPRTAAASPPPEPAPGSTLGEWPADTRLSYALGGFYRGDLHGDAKVQWQRSADRYQASVNVNIGWLASFSMTSQGRLTPQELQPSAYEEQVRSNRRSFEIQGSNIVMANGERVPKPDQVQDTASQFVELTHRFATGRERLEAGQAVQLWLARPGGVDLWTYDVLEGEPLNTARWGVLPTYHLVPRPLARPRGPITAEIWFAPALQYFPVRIKMNLGPQVWLDLVIEKIEQAETTTRP